MDLDRVILDSGTMTVKHPTTDAPLDHDGKPVTIDLYNADSELMRNAFRRQRDRLSDETRRGVQLTAREGDERDLEMLVSATKSWSAMPFRGKNLDCTPANAMLVYDQLPWLRRQVDRFIGTLKNFAGASAES